MATASRASRVSAFAVLTTVFLLASLLGTVASASPPSSTYVPGVAPTCVAVNSSVTFTATIKNTSSSASLGSATFESSSSNGFHNIYSGSFTTPVVTNASGGTSAKTWRAIADHHDADAISLQATSSGNALAPNETVTVSFVATTPKTTGNRTWSTAAWIGTGFYGTKLVRSGPDPVVLVSNTCLGPPSKLVFGQQPPAGSSVPAGNSLGVVTVKLEDANNNVITTDSTHHVTLAIGTNPGGGTLTGGGTVTLSHGVATYPGPSIDKIGTGYTLAASSSDLSVTNATSNAFNIVLNGPTHLKFGLQPSSAQAGASLGTVTVQLLDKGNNVVTTDSTHHVTLAIGTNAGGGTLTGGGTVTLSNGVATYPGPSIDKIGTGYTLAATSPDLSVTGATSNAFDVTLNAPDHLAFSLQPSSAQGGHSLGTVTVLLLDKGGNLITSDSTHQVALAITSGTPSTGGPGTLTGGDAVTLSGGTATFPSPSIDRIGTGYMLTATSPDLSVTSATSNPFDVLLGPPFAVTFDGPNGQQPANTVLGSDIDGGSGGVKVSVTDQGGNPVPSVGVTVSIGTDPTGSGTLSGTGCASGVCTGTTDPNGVATFPDLQIAPTSSGYQLEATVTALTPALSDTFAITNTDPTTCGLGDNPPCEATFDTGGTVTAPPGTTLIIETNQLDCSGIESPIAGTVTIIPNGSGPSAIPVTFDDTISFPINGSYPFCKTIDNGASTETVPFCDTVNGLDQDPVNGVACITESVVLHGSDPPTLHSVLWINATDPGARH